MSAEDTPKRRVLFVDDEKSVLDGLRRILRSKRSEWEMTFAEGVSEAIEALERDPYDTIVSDINMPERDGFDLLETVLSSEEWKAIPVVILTGNGESGLKRKALNLGATDLLSKPVDPDDLVARIRSVLRIKAYEDEIKAHNQELEERVRDRTAQLEMAQVELIWRLGKAGEFRDSDTGYHVVRVGFFARRIAEELGLESEFQRKIFLTAPLHDIGKIGIPDHILLKPGKLTDEEWVTMRDHTHYGAQILRDGIIAKDKIHRLGIVSSNVITTLENPFIEMAARIAEAHHERWDGSGYPHKVVGEDIPIEARIASLADVYDALCSRRPYKEPFGEDQVLDIMSKGAGTQFDPSVFAAFQNCLEDFRNIRAEFDDETLSEPQADIVPSLTDLRKAS